MLFFENSANMLTVVDAGSKDQYGVTIPGLLNDLTACRLLLLYQCP